MKYVLLAVLAVVAWFGGRALWRAMASDETRIGWLVADEAAAFNGAAPLSILSGFAPEYREDTVGLDRNGLRAALLWAFQNQRAGDGAFRYRVEIAPESLDATVDGDSAQAGFGLLLFDRRTGQDAPIWEIDVKAGLRRRDGDWSFVRSTHTTLRGQRPH
jgi:hypothetical protein